MRTSFTSHHGRAQWQLLSVFFLLLLGLLLVACGQAGTQDATTALGTACPSTSALAGSGSTFDAPRFSKMFAAYAHVPCGLAVSYLGDGSGAGVNDLLQQQGDFAATDIPLTNGALARSQHGPIL